MSVVVVIVDVDCGVDRDYWDIEIGEWSVFCCGGYGLFLSLEIEDVEIIVDVDCWFKFFVKVVDFVVYDGKCMWVFWFRIWFFLIYLVNNIKIEILLIL